MKERKYLMTLMRERVRVFVHQMGTSPANAAINAVESKVATPEAILRVREAVIHG